MVMTMLRTQPIVATVGGVPTDVIRFDAHHSVDTPVATGSITVTLPLPPHMSGGHPNAVLNRPVSIQAGYHGQDLRPVFNGFIASDRMTVSPDGHTAQLSLEGYGRLLAWPESGDLSWPGGTYLDEIARALCVMRGVPKYQINRVLAPNGTRVRLGGNPNIDGGRIIIPSTTTPLIWLTRILKLFGYRAFDRTDEFRVQRVSGIPVPMSALNPHEEGRWVHRMDRTRDLKDMVTAWTVEGPEYVDDDGVRIPIRSFPGGVVPYEPLLNPPGYRERTVRENQLVTFDLAHIVRQVHEINYTIPSTVWTLNRRGAGIINAGMVIRTASSNMEAVPANMWVMDVRQQLSTDSGYQMVVTAWSGGTMVLQDGDDLQTINVRSAPLHLGDENVPWYAMPNPAGTSYTIDVDIPDTFTSLAISLYAHGCNSHMLDGANHESTVSKIEVWQNGEEVGSTDLPVIDEDYTQQLPYGSGLTHWQHFRMPVPGRLEAGPSEIRIVCGEHPSLPVGLKKDDFEVRNITLELRGAGSPTLPTNGGS